MKPLSWDKQLGLVSPLKCAAIQSEQTNDPSRNETGLDASHHIHVSPEGSGKYFFLDILFNRMSAMAIYRQVIDQRVPVRISRGDFSTVTQAASRFAIIPASVFPRNAG
ncbi:MAG TPA: hypothetical protein VK208_05560, partial [Pyrinomonadaceae bacterium]|nr:hypothetical protein [Pyrinomonadaceae bacterium]